MRRVVFVNPDCLNKAYNDADYKYLIQRSDLVLPDGSGLRLAAKLLQLPMVDNVNGTDLFPLLCEAAAARGLSVFLYGGKPGIADQAARFARARFAGLRIAGSCDGFTHQNNPREVVEKVNASGADILLVGLGAPLQERWLHENSEQLQVSVGIGVGGLFDYFSGRIKRAPLWMRESGIEWVWRILQEPGKKWVRYVVGNPLFVLRVLHERKVRHQLRSRQLKPGISLQQTESMQSSGLLRRWKLGLFLSRISKRGIDIFLSAGALLTLSPLLLATAILIRFESPGPVLFCQARVGKRGAVFKMFKFRSMYMDAEKRLDQLKSQNQSAGGVLFKMKNDPRITRVGKIIRRLSIDELPQIFNVLRGEMSIVGPRPALPSEVSQYASNERKRLQVNPGLTCFWQVGGRSDLSFEQQIQLDIEYLQKQDVLTDLAVIARTVPAIIHGKGAY